MNSALKKINKITGKLPPVSQAEVLDFAEFLLRRKKALKKGVKLRQNWAGGLRKFRKNFTSLELQKRSLEWRSS
jgi:hypothetical protein